MSTLKSKENCVGEYPALWRINFKFTQPIRRSVDGTGETEQIGSQIADGQYDVVAVTRGIAQETFLANCPVYAAGDDQFKSEPPEFVCYVDAIMLAQKSYGGHFS